jgi:hypothetical protein
MSFLSLFAASTTCGPETFFEWGCSSSDNAIIETIISIFNWASIGVGVVVVAFVIVGAIVYTTAAGNQERSKKGMEIIRNAILALILYLAMWAFLNYLVPGGLFK